MDTPIFRKFSDYEVLPYYILLLLLLVSERSERDTYRINTIENRGCLFIYILVVCLSTNGERA